MKYTFLKDNNLPAFLGDDFEISYSSMYANVLEFSKRVPKERAHVAIYAENSPEWVCALYGAWLKHSTVVPVDATLPVAETAFILSDSETDFLFASKANLENAKAAVEKSGRAVEICVIEEVEKPLMNATLPNGWKIECDAEDLAFIVYTSGTTSNPKGVMLTFDNLQANIEAVSDEGYFHEKMRTLAMLPFQHILPLVGTVVGVLYVGGAIVFPKSLAPADIAGVLAKRKATMVISVPRFYELIHANIMEKVNKSIAVKSLFLLSKFAGSVKFARMLFASIHKRFGGKVSAWVCGGAALNREVNADLSALGFKICEGYGMTEAAPIIAFPRIGNIKIGSCGQPLPSNEVRIVDGEIIVRGRSITKGYYRRPEENEASFNNGWLYTGDLGYFDDDGFLFITGRRKEIIVLPNGKKLNPIELEEQIKEKCPSLEEVGVLMYDDILQAVCRISDKMYAELGKEGAEDFVRENAILPYNRANASYRRIIRFTVTTKEFPRTRIGKLKRFQLASFVESVKTELPIEQVFAPEPESKIYKDLKEFLAMQVSVTVLPDAHMEMDLGLDSLGKVALHGFIKENYNIDMQESDFEKYSSLRKVANFIEEEQKKKTEEKAVADAPKPRKPKAVAWSEILKNCTPPAIPKTYFFHSITLLAARIFFKFWYDIEIEGRENIKDGEPMIVAPNHQSLCDGFFFAKMFPRKKVYKFYFFAKMRAMMSSKFMKFYVRHSNIIVVDVKSNIKESVQKLAEILRKKNYVVMFPEGTRTRDGNVAEFKPMFAILAKEMGVRVVPMVISGAFEGLKARASLPARGTKIKIKLLPPVSVEEGESYADFSNRVREIVIAEKAKIEGRELSAD